MSSQTELLKLALLQLSLTPNPWTAGAHFNQTLDLATGTVIIELGTAVIRVWVDAMTDVQQLKLRIIFLGHFSRI